MFSLGLLDPTTVAQYTAAHDADPTSRARAGTLLFYAMGRDDMFHRTVVPTWQVLDRHGIRYIYHETAGGHTWTNWRAYLAAFAPLLFR